MRSTFSEVVRTLLHDHGRETAVLAVAPAVVILVLGLLFGGGFRGLGVAVVNNDEGFDMPFVGPLCMADKVVERLDSRTFTVTRVTSMEEAEKGARDGRFAAILEFPAGFTQDLLISREDPTFKMESKVRLLTDQSNYPAMAAVTQDMMNAFLGAAADAGGASIPLERGAISGMSARFFDFIVTALGLLFTFILAAMLPLRALTKARAEGGPFHGIREQGAIAGGSALVFGAAALLQAGLITTAAWATFPLTAPGHPGLACLLLALHVMVAVMLGTCCARVTSRPSAFIPVLVSPLLFAGVIIPLEALPYWVRPLAWVYPHWYTVHGVRGALVRGLGAGDVARDVIALGCFLILFTVLAALPKRAAREGGKA